MTTILLNWFLYQGSAPALVVKASEYYRSVKALDVDLQIRFNTSKGKAHLTWVKPLNQRFTLNFGAEMREYVQNATGRWEINRTASIFTRFEAVDGAYPYQDLMGTVGVNLYPDFLLMAADPKAPLNRIRWQEQREHSNGGRIFVAAQQDGPSKLTRTMVLEPTGRISKFTYLFEEPQGTSETEFILGPENKKTPSTRIEPDLKGLSNAIMEDRQMARPAGTSLPDLKVKVGSTTRAIHELGSSILALMRPGNAPDDGFLKSIPADLRARITVIAPEGSSGADAICSESDIAILAPEGTPTLYHVGKGATIRRSWYGYQPEKSGKLWDEVRAALAQ
ncbi:MAG: hypothetical protein JST40_00990 [Armatimonadetes bacterium]|nr:hypothetical protein [Armatimonadota bacterium]